MTNINRAKVIELGVGLAHAMIVSQPLGASRSEPAVVVKHRIHHHATSFPQAKSSILPTVAK